MKELWYQFVTIGIPVAVAVGLAIGLLYTSIHEIYETWYSKIWRPWNKPWYEKTRWHKIYKRFTDRRTLTPQNETRQSESSYFVKWYSPSYDDARPVSVIEAIKHAHATLDMLQHEIEDNGRSDRQFIKLEARTERTHCDSQFWVEIEIGEALKNVQPKNETCPVCSKTPSKNNECLYCRFLFPLEEG